MVTQETPIIGKGQLLFIWLSCISHLTNFILKLETIHILDTTLSMPSVICFVESYKKHGICFVESYKKHVTDRTNV